MPTFGYTTQGGSNVSILNFQRGSVYTGAVGLTVTLHAALTGATGAGTSNKCAMYTYDGDLTNSLFGTTDENNGAHSDGFQTFTMNPTVTTAVQDYVLAIWSDTETQPGTTKGGPTAANRFKFDSGGTGPELSKTYNGWDDPVTWTTSRNRKYSIYATYTTFGMGWWGPEGYF